MSDKKPNANVSKWNDPNRLNRAYQKRRDDDIIKVPEVNLYDVDYAIMYYLREVISPRIDSEDLSIDVPVMYGNGETWSQIKETGFIRDLKNKVKTPLIVLRRSNSYERQDVKKLEVNNGPSSRYYINRYPRNLENKFDKLKETQNTEFSNEFYISLIPRYYKVVYDISIWTEYEADMNQIVESILPNSGHSWGDTLLFTTTVGEFSYGTINPPDAERVVTANTTFTVDGYLVNTFDIKKSNVEKAVSIKRVVFNSERDGGLDTNFNF